MGEVVGELGPARACRGVKFRYFNPRASKAYIAGEFNNWRATDCAMRKHPCGVWEIVVPLGEGEHEYKFVVDGEWTRDPHNPCMTLNEHGTANSVVEVSPAGEVLTPAPQPEAHGFGRFRAVSSPDWAHDAIVYEVFPRVFSEEGTLEAVTRRIPYIADLGATCIWLMPIHDIGRRGRKGSLGSPYAIRDYLSIHHDLGTPEDLRQLVKTAHSHGLRVIMDFVANHSALDCVLTVAHPEWYRRDAQGNIQTAGFGWDDVAAFDYSSAELRNYMIRVMRHYVEEFDIDGYRCDVAALVPTDFWRAARRVLKAIKPDVLLLAESHEPVHNATAFDVTYEETLPKIVSQVLSRELPARTIRDMIESSRRSFPAGSLRLRYLENHDQLRAVRAIGRRGYEVAATLLFTLDGVPLIYGGQEIGEEEKPSLFEPFKIRWEAGDPVIAAMYRDLCGLRRDIPALRRGLLAFLDIGRDDAGLVYYREHGESRVIVALNFTGDVIHAKIDAPGERLAGIDPESVYSLRALRGQPPCGSIRLRGQDLCSLELTLEPFGVRVLAVRDCRSDALDTCA